MYTAFYGLREKPFALSPDPRFLYLAGSHREALAHLLYGIEQGEGFISVTGEVGTGKTTLCRTLLERLDGDTELAFLFNPSRSALELLQSICAEFGLPAEGLTRRALMEQLNRFLVEQKRASKRVLLIIDEAQNLSENTLEQVRLLSNLETSREKLIQILLLGQPELDRKLDERGLRQLRQRISVRWKLEPLDATETRAYVRHRLAVAAGEPKDLFSDAALREVHRRTGGIPRLVNQLCDRALLAGYAARAAKIGPKLAREAAREIPDARLPREARGDLRPRGRAAAFFRPWMFVVLAGALVGVSLLAGLQVGRSGLSHSMAAALFKPGIPENGFSESKALPAVGANAIDPVTPKRVDRSEIVVIDPSGRGVSTGGAAAAVGEGTPSTVELIGYVPEALRRELAADGVTDRVEQVQRAGLSAETPAAGSASGAAPESEPALSPGLLPQLLASRTADHAIAEAGEVLLGRFGRRVVALAGSPRSPRALQRSFEDRGLMATSFDGGSLELLRRLDHPVALPLAPSPERANGLAPRAPEEARRWVAITGFRGDHARVAGLVPDQIVTITVEELEAHWLETGILVWERFEPVSSLLTKDDEGRGVLWLQRGLSELRFYDGAPSSRYDADTTAAVRRFQTEAGLVDDGIAGPLTQIALYASLTRYPVPRLSQAAAASAPPPVATSAPAPPAESTLETTRGDRG